MINYIKYIFSLSNSAFKKLHLKTIFGFVSLLGQLKWFFFLQPTKMVFSLTKWSKLPPKYI